MKQKTELVIYLSIFPLLWLIAPSSGITRIALMFLMSQALLGVFIVIVCDFFYKD